MPSAIDNRPLNFSEFQKRIHQVIYVSATPGEYELERVVKNQVVEQIIRPTGLLDPEIAIYPTEYQIDHIISETKLRVAKKERILLITLTKRMAEDLSEYLLDKGFKVRYLHSEVHTLERVKIIKDLRRGIFDILVGINLLREGLDIPEVSLIGILDADKEGFLRNERTLIQIIGRAARNAHGKVFLYADKLTASMRKAIDETNRRRKLQLDFNHKHQIVPKTIFKKIIDNTNIDAQKPAKKDQMDLKIPDFISPAELPKYIGRLKKEMQEAAALLDFERAALIRDKIEELNKTS